jgi:copper chaperone NosL
MRKVSRTLLVFAALLAACAGVAVKPVDIEANDMCSFCRMAISEKRYAAEIIDQEENVMKFDDIGCMLRYRDAAGATLKPEAIFVADFESREWLLAEKAFFARPANVKTPMGSGIVAYTSREKAGPEAVTFDRLTTERK